MYETIEEREMHFIKLTDMCALFGVWFFCARARWRAGGGGDGGLGSHNPPSINTPG